MLRIVGRHHLAHRAAPEALADPEATDPRRDRLGVAPGVEHRRAGGQIAAAGAHFAAASRVSASGQSMALLPRRSRVANVARPRSW